MPKLVLAIVPLVPLVLSTCVDRFLFAPTEGFARHEPDARYEALFPHYVELCAVSQFRSEQLGTGSSPGHATMYLKGACRDTEAPYPRLRHCARNETDPNDPEHGAGISVNRWFRSVNWVAFAGRGQFYEGHRNPDEPVTLELLDELSRKAVEDGVFRGVEMWPWPGQTSESDAVEFARLRSIGTDFALQLARSALCGRVPVEAEMMDEIIHFLNDLNREYFTGTVDFQWSVFSDNCAHTLRNALAAASVWAPRSVAANRLRQLFHLAIPANEALILAELGTSGPIDSYTRIFRNDPMRNALLEFGWLPTRHGALLVSLRVHQNNRVFDPQPRLLVVQGPLMTRRTAKLLKMLEDPRFTDLDANLAHFEGVYRDILARPPEAEGLAPLRGDRYRRVRRRYLSVIESELAEVERMRAGLAASPPSSGRVTPGRAAASYRP